MQVRESQSTNIPLLAAGVFTSSLAVSTGSGSISISVFSSHASAADGLAIEQSHDGEHWDIADYADVPANQALFFSVQLIALYYRVVYTNGAVDQTAFRLQTRSRGWPGNVQERSTIPSKFIQVAVNALTDAVLVTAPGVGKRIVLRSITGANNAPTLTTLTLKDGTVAFFALPCMANGGGFPNPLTQEKILTPNAALQASLSLAVTSVYVNCEYVIIK